VDILELAQDFTVLAQENVTGGFEDGNSFSYTSIIGDTGNAIEVPRVLQLNIFAVNAENQPIVNFFAISFTNDCGFYPVLSEGNSAGWIELVSFSGLSLRSSFAWHTLNNAILSS
jgi:hypothetical protein